MKDVEQWNKRQAIFRGIPGKPLSESISCGFINKSGYTEDITEEHYDRFAMVYVLRGNGHYRDSHGLDFPLQEGDVFLRCPDRIHSNTVKPDSQWLECFASVRSEWYTLFKEIGVVYLDRIHAAIGDQSSIPQTIDHLMQALNASDTPLNNSHVEFELATLIRRILMQGLQSQGSHSPQQHKVERARSLIREHATKADDLAAILQPLALSYSRLRSLFSQTYGISPGDYRIQVRIEQACALLETSQLSIQEIADRLGYADAFTFSKQFKQRLGVAPSHFRKR
ncbi:MAG: hypothetical protein CML13_05970 [Puniceicoccaceae bacterium]|nr:hypothetical protein [Puniceicoccaceae bacterium]|tara:strand:- start:3812 stop:4657 length:846 start_codon:yes stop_codon:yes gene_type:complete